MSQFTLEWLRLREAFDRDARDRGCAVRFASALGKPRGRPLRVLDLAAGSGASFRALAPIIGIGQSWTLVDHDIGMLDAQAGEIARWAEAAQWSTQVAIRSSSSWRLPPREARRQALERGVAASIDAAPRPQRTVAPRRETAIRAHGTWWTAQARRMRLQRDLDALDFAGFDGITTSAFLDLVSLAWLERFASKLIASRRPLLATLSVNGERSWAPALVGDEYVHAAFERHQSGDKGFGPALGGMAVQRLAAVLGAADYEVTIARSDWHIGPAAVAMLRVLLEDTLHAAVEAEPQSAHAFESWGSARRAQLAHGSLSLHVGHFDLVALPAHSKSRTE